jgi:protein-tyrosine phosphatase
MNKIILAFVILMISAPSFTGIEDFNFGVVIKNKNYQIYRSTTLGNKGVAEVWKYLASNNMPAPKAVVYLSDEGFKTRFLSQDLGLQEYLIQDQYGFKMFHSFDYKQRTYLDGRDPEVPSEDIDHKNNLSEDAQKYFGPDPQDGIDGGMDALYRILDIVLDPANQPAMIHCLGGKNRTGMVSMILKYLQSDSAQEIISEDPLIRTRAEVEYKKFAGRFGAKAENIYFVRRFLATKEFKEYLQKYRHKLE